MIFKNKVEAKIHFLNYQAIIQEVPGDTLYPGPLAPTFNMLYDGLKFGDRILFRHIKPEGGNRRRSVISRPIIAIFLGISAWDMATVINFVQPRRAWITNCKIGDNEENATPERLDDYEAEQIQFWTDNVILLGHWKTKPTFGELRKALKENS
jgi:hypothetical protein